MKVIFIDLDEEFAPIKKKLEKERRKALITTGSFWLLALVATYFIAADNLLAWIAAIAIICLSYYAMSRDYPLAGNEQILRRALYKVPDNYSLYKTFDGHKELKAQLKEWVFSKTRIETGEYMPDLQPYEPLVIVEDNIYKLYVDIEAKPEPDAFKQMIDKILDGGKNEKKS